MFIILKCSLIIRFSIAFGKKLLTSYEEKNYKIAKVSIKWKYFLFYFLWKYFFNCEMYSQF